MCGAASARQRERRGLTHRVEPDGSITITARLAATDAALALAAIETNLAPAKDDDGQLVPINVRRADALVDTIAATSVGTVVHVPVDADVLAGNTGQCSIEPLGDTVDTPLPISVETVFRCLCDAPIIGVVHGPPDAARPHHRVDEGGWQLWLTDHDAVEAVTPNGTPTRRPTPKHIGDPSTAPPTPRLRGGAAALSGLQPKPTSASQASNRSLSATTTSGPSPRAGGGSTGRRAGR